jgi:hypothetical protein
VGNTYKIKRAFLLPLLLVTGLLFILFLISLFNGQMWEKIILAVFFVCSLAVGVENAKREIVVSDEGVKIKKFFRVKTFVWNEVTNLAMVILRKKAYFLLTTTKGFYIFSNLFENHALLVRSLADKLGAEKVEIEVMAYLDKPAERLSLIVMIWIAVVILLAIISLKLAGI